MEIRIPTSRRFWITIVAYIDFSALETTLRRVAGDDYALRIADGAGTTLAAIGDAGADPLGVSSPVGRLGGGWSVTVETSRPFYREGGGAHVRATIANFTDQWANIAYNTTGGNGCRIAVRIVDRNGDVVYQPGSIVNGQFQGPGCLFGGRVVTLGPGDTEVNETQLPLIYQNSSGRGQLGAPLPAGLYGFEVDLLYIGPYQAPILQSGGGFAARVPFQIVP